VLVVKVVPVILVSEPGRPYPSAFASFVRVRVAERSECRECFHGVTDIGVPIWLRVHGDLYVCVMYVM
jgi:hypothetical protein